MYPDNNVEELFEVFRGTSQWIKDVNIPHHDYKSPYEIYFRSYEFLRGNNDNV